jgi:hypothetical protein
MVNSGIVDNFQNCVLSVKTWSPFWSFKYFNICTSVETAAVIIKCAFCVKIVILESVSACEFGMCYKNSQELPEDGIDKSWNTSEL